MGLDEKYKLLSNRCGPNCAHSFQSPPSAGFLHSPPPEQFSAYVAIRDFDSVAAGIFLSKELPMWLVDIAVAFEDEKEAQDFAEILSEMLDEDIEPELMDRTSLQ
jgi:hypothetical protein